MKKSKLLVPVLALALLASCAGTSSSSGATTPTLEAKTFQDQITLAGIEGYTYVDPNESLYEKETAPSDGQGDVISGASGGDYYPASGGGSYYTLERMYERANLQYYIYSWEETSAENENVGTGATTLQQAVKLENAEHITDMFPNDGKEYVIAEAHNAVATKTLITSDGTDYNVAVYGMGAVKEDNKYYFSGAITMKPTLKNLVKTGEGKIIMYEYNPTSTDKTGPGNRNYGCRVDVKLDFAKSTFGDYKPTLGEDLPDTVAYGMVKLEVTALYTLG